MLADTRFKDTTNGDGGNGGFRLSGVLPNAPLRLGDRRQDRVFLTLLADIKLFSLLLPGTLTSSSSFLHVCLAIPPTLL